MKTDEHYAGILLDDGKARHVFLLSAEPTGPLTWTDAQAWAESVGGRLPTAQECRLLHVNCAQHLLKEWYWTSHGRPWPNGSAMYYSAAHGHTGERDPLERLIARAVRSATAAHLPPDPTPGTGVTQ